MIKTLRNAIGVAVLFLIGTLFFSSLNVHAQVTTVETETVTWTDITKPYGSGSWTTYTIGAASGIAAGSTSLRARYITVGNAGLTPGIYNVDLTWFDTNAETASILYIQVGRRTCEGTTAAVCSSGNLSVNEALTLNTAVNAAQTKSLTGITISSSDTIFFFSKLAGGSGRGWVDNIKFTKDLTVPYIENKSFTIEKSTSPTGSNVGSAAASGPAGMTYSITAGNTGGGFAINPSTGQITVAGPVTEGTYTLTVNVATNGTPSKTATATVTIRVDDINAHGGVACTNMGFESGNFSNWNGNFRDRCTNCDGTNTVGPAGALNTGFGQHCIMNTTYKDPFIPTLPVVAPGGNYSCRLGNVNSGGDIATLSRTFTVSAENAIFLYQYAVVLEDPTGAAGHDNLDAPHFQSYLTVGGSRISCSEYLAIADASASSSGLTALCSNGSTSDDPQGNADCPGPPAGDYATSAPALSGSCSGTTIYYKPWTTVAIPLNNYIGQTVTISFTAADCMPNGHMGYAYVDADCRPYQPALPSTFCPANGNHTITAMDGFQTYSWVASNGGTIVSGANARAVVLNKAGTYTVTMKPFGTCPPITQAYTVTEACPCAAPTITAQPAPSTICVGANTSFTSTANGTGPLTYKWEVSTNGGGTFTTVSNGGVYSGATTTTLTLTAPPVTMSTYQYRMVATLTASCLVTSNAAVLTVNPLPVPAASPQTICSGATSSVAITSSVAGSTYAWTATPSAATITGSSNGTGTPIAQTLTNTGTANGTVSYSITATANGCVGTPVPVIVTVNPPLVPGVIGTDQTICISNAAAALTEVTPASGGSGTYTYQWEKSSDGITYATITGATSSTYSPGTLTATTWFQRKVTSCGTLTSNPVKITVDPLVTPGTIATAQTICSGQTPAALTQASAAGGGVGTYTYAWQSSADNTNWTDIAATNTTGYSPGAVSVATYFRRKVSSGSCPPVFTPSILISVTSTTAGAITAAQTICYNTAPAALTELTPQTGGIPPLTYQWQSSPDNVAWTDIAGATNPASYAPGPLTANMYYRRNINSCGMLSTQPVLITVNPALTPGAVAADQTLCSSVQPAALTETTAPTGGTGTYTYQWQSSPDASTWSNIAGATSATFAPPVLAATTSYRRAVTSAPCGTLFTPPVTITIYPPLTSGSISQPPQICYNQAPQPLTNVTSPTGGNGTYTYQWQSSTDNTTWTDIAGATLQDYTSGALTQTTWFRRAVNSGGCGPLYTPSQVVVISPAPGEIQVDQTICNGAIPALLTEKSPPVGASTPPQFQWQESSNGITFTDIAGATAQTYQPSALTSTMYYRRGLLGTSCGALYTLPVKITVYPLLTPGAVTADQTICSGAAPVLLTEALAAAGGSGTYTYQWQNSTDNSTWTNIAGATSTTYQPPVLTQSTYYRRSVTSCGTLFTPSILITVNPNLPVSLTISDPSPICAGELVTIGATPVNGGTAPTYVWMVNNGIVAGVTGPSYSSSTLTNGTTIMAILTSNEKCVTNNPASSNIVTVVVSGIVTPAVSISLPPVICAGESVTLNVVSSSGGGTPVYQWRFNGANVAGATGTSFTPTGVLKTNDSISVVMTSNSTCASQPTAHSNVVVMTVNPIPVISASNATLCSGAATNIAINSTVSGTTYDWTATAPAAITGFVATGTSSTITHTLTNTATTAGDVTYAIKGSANGCAATPITVVITVNPTPDAIAADRTICSGTAPTPAIAITSGVTGTTFTYVAETSTLSGATNGTGASIGQTLTHTSGSPVIQTYTITPTANTCVGPVKQVKVTVNPTPIATALPDQKCSGVPISINISSNIPPPVLTTYSWTATPTGVNPTGNGTNSPITQTIINTGTANGTMSYDIIPTSQTCVGPVTTVVATIFPVPVATITGKPTICGGEKSSEQVTSTVTPGTTYTWSVSATAPAVLGTGEATSGTVSGDSISQVLMNTGLNQGSAVYTVIPTANGCKGDPKTHTVNVNPAPDAILSTTPICSKDAASIKVETSNPALGVSFTWTAPTTGPVTGSQGSGSLAAPGTISEASLINAGTTNATLSYTVIPTAAGCVGPAKTIDITVKPIPVLSTVNNKRILCSGEVTDITASSTVAGTLLTITANGLGNSKSFSGSSNASPASIKQTLTTTSQVDAIYTIGGAANGCPALPVRDTATVHPIPTPAAGMDTTYCEGGSYVLGTGSNAAWRYSWTPVTGLNSDTIGSPLTNTTVTTTYTVTATLRANASCKNTDNVTVKVDPKIDVEAIPDFPICALDPVTLSAFPKTFDSYVWSPAVGKGHTITFTGPEDTTEYIVTATAGKCTDTAAVIINVKNFKNPTLFIPNTFSPNNDDKNDVFKVYGEGIIEIEGMIFDRWGTMYYTWTDINGGWKGDIPDGTKALNDVYVYTVRVKNVCDKKFRPARTGTVTIIK